MKHKLKILLISFFLTGCTFSDLTDPFTDLLKSDEILFLSAYENVKIVEQDSQLTGKNSHPVNISQERVEGALKLLLFRVGNSTQSLFPGIKLDVISYNISKGLSKADKNQDIVFTMEDWYSNLPGTRFKDNRVVSARVFYNKDGLNVIFGSVLRKGFQSTTDPMLVSRNPDLKSNPYVPGSRLFSVKNPFALSVPPNSGIMRPRVAKGRVDWIILTGKSLIARSNLSESDRKSARSSNIEVQGLKSEVQQLRQELQSLKGGPNQRYRYNTQPYPYPQPYQYQRTYPYQQPSPYQQPYAYPYAKPNIYQNQQYGQPSPLPPNNQLSLKSLENMRSRGLISEESYLRKLKELGY
tara:strand:- start:16 stop:1074 length:1059 start_codon:yes stop_codon:yes gene_type:complete